MTKLDSDGVRLCDHNDCELPATHTLVWTKQQYYCIVHAQQALNVAQMMGFPTAGNTARLMTPDEMLPPTPPTFAAHKTFTGLDLYNTTHR